MHTNLPELEEISVLRAHGAVGYEEDNGSILYQAEHYGLVTPVITWDVPSDFNLQPVWYLGSVLIDVLAVFDLYDETQFYSTEAVVVAGDLLEDIGHDRRLTFEALTLMNNDTWYNRSANRRRQYLTDDLERCIQLAKITSLAPEQKVRLVPLDISVEQVREQVAAGVPASLIIELHQSAAANA